MKKISDTHVQACMDTWLHCEELLLSLTRKSTSFSRRTMQIIDECAHICFRVLQALNLKGKNLHHVALLCVGICEECAEVCERYSDHHFQACANTCRQCSALFTPIAAESM